MNPSRRSRAALRSLRDCRGGFLPPTLRFSLCFTHPRACNRRAPAPQRSLFVVILRSRIVATKDLAADFAFTPARAWSFLVRRNPARRFSNFSLRVSSLLLLADHRPLIADDLQLRGAL